MPRKTLKTVGSKSTVKADALPAKKIVTFLEMPGEIRNQVYGHVLPDLQAWQFSHSKSLRKDGQKSFTNLMATSRQVHDEAVSILYGSQEFDASVTANGCISFLNQRVEFSALHSANFSALNQIQALSLYVSANDSVNVCNVQDALFVFFSHLKDNHKLHTLKVNIDVSKAHDNSARYEIFSSNYAERMFKDNIMREFRNIAPGDISRAHLTAFLTDPLCIIRNLRNGGKKGRFTLDFTGKTGRPWRNIHGHVRTLIQSDSPVPDYKIFHEYFAVLWELLGVTDMLDLGFSRRSREVVKLISSRIRGDVDKFRRHHNDLAIAISDIMSEKLDFSNSESYDEAEQREQKTREAICLMQELKAKLPRHNADTSFFGYNEADAALREWQLTGRHEEKAAKEKCKREKEASAGARKKTKVGEQK